MANRDHKSVLGRTTRLAGKLQGEGELVIEGSVRGDVSVTGPLEIQSGASVEGNVIADSLLVHGTLQGDVRTAGPVTIGGEASVRGSLSGARISIDPGARVSVTMASEFELDLELEKAPRRRR